MKLSKYIMRNATALALAAVVCVSGASAPIHAEKTEYFTVAAQNTAVSEEQIADGTYTANVIMRNASNPAQNSMSNAAISNPVTITVKDGRYTITASFHGITINLLGESFFGYLKELYYKDADGKYVQSTVNEYYDILDMYNTKEDSTAEYYYPKELSFPLVNGKAGDTKEGYVELQVFVPIMEAIATGSGTQRVYMDIDWASLKVVSEMPEETATIAPEETATIAPEATATIVPEETATIAPEATATIAPEETATIAPEATATIVPEETATIAPEETATIAPEATATIAPEETATIAPEETATIAPEATAPVAPETKEPALKKNQSVTVGNNTYKVTNVGKNAAVEFTGTNTKKTSVSIPEVIKKNDVTYKVTSIKANAFKNNKNITSVTISKNITKIGKNAFYGAGKLKKIKIQSVVITTIGTKAFSGIQKKAVIELSKKLSKKQKTSLKKKLNKAGIPKTAKIK